MSQILINEKYDAKLSFKNPNLIRLGDYKQHNIFIKHKCIKCGIIKNLQPTTALRGRSCYYCKMNERFKSDEQYKSELPIKVE